ncbi:MAG: glutathione S-transferase family protein [Leptolyngbya sp. SIO4C5]|nr:glutathione S-transferase family protein [Leptolyngbya sp. SIO4C5]
MLELYQFEGSHYSEKIRLILDYKQLSYRKVEVAPGVGQIDLYRMSGQRQVPVLKDDNEVIPDSTAIAQYLDEKYPERPVIPTTPKQRGLCLMMEAWADESIGLNARTAMIGAFNQHPNFRTALLPASTPELLKNLVGSVPGDVLSLLGTGAGFGADAVKTAHAILQQNLEALCLLLQESPYLVGDQPTLADFAVAGLSMYIKFPDRQYVDLPTGICGKGVPGLADDPTYRPFFGWRDRLYADYREVSIPNTAETVGPGPQSISID